MRVDFFGAVTAGFLAITLDTTVFLLGVEELTFLTGVVGLTAVLVATGLALGVD